ncbi:MAG: serine/threonine-protein kinase [Kofleriaceae bacterium]
MRNVPTDADTVALGVPMTLASVESRAAPASVPHGYTLGRLLGSGGMGDVVLAHDPRIGRDVAIKRMKHADPTGELATRFLREARIQARLEHPAIVPVHEVGSDPDGRPYFTMKRLAGVTLAELLETGAPQRRLLHAFLDVCSAIEFAHASGVIHRDLKPPNIMLGDFGEVYVLDWGVARLVGEKAIASHGLTTLAGETQAGALIGTPGYMAPEQVAGAAVDAPADVYALGAILFEILAGVSLHPRGNKAFASTVARPTEAPSTRRPEAHVPPELDAIVVAALAADPDDRISASALAAGVRSYLDGDRDLERRRELADEQLARAVLASGDPARRSEALRAAARALALVPESVTAAQFVSALILEPPATVEPALASSLEATEREASRVRSKHSMLAFIVGAAFLAAVPFLDVRSTPLLVGFFASLLGLAAMAYLSYRRGRTVEPVALASTLIAIAFLSRFAGPFVITPVIVVGMLNALVTGSWMQRHATVVVGWAMLAIAIPIGLEELGVFARTWWQDGDTLVFRSGILEGTGAAMPIALVVMNLTFIALIGLYARATTRHRQKAERSLHVQAWHLRQLLP